MELIILQLQETPKKVLILICYDCHRMFEKTFFLDENFFDEVKKCLIELYPKKWRFQVFATGERKIDKHIKRQFKRVS